MNPPFYVWLFFVTYDQITFVYTSCSVKYWSGERGQSQKNRGVKLENLILRESNLMVASLEN